MMPYSDYLTSANRKPNIIQIVDGLTQPMADAQISPNFDIDTANSWELDIIGEWVGVSRYLQTPLDVLAQWDDPTRGWDSSYGWYQDGQPQTGLTTLNDTSYRALIKYAIAKNIGDGTKQSVYNAVSNLAAGSSIAIEDMGGMSINVIVTGAPLDIITLAMLRNGTISLAPFGVATGYIVQPSQAGPIAMWDILTPEMGGWDVSNWAKF